VQVHLTTDQAEVDELIEVARDAYAERNERIANLTDESVDTFYSCLLCQSFAPNHVCVVNPERVGLCGAYNWLDCKASYEINPTGPNQPVPKGLTLDPVKGEFSGPNEFIYRQSNQTVEKVTFYSIMEAPMTSCGCFECIMVLVLDARRHRRRRHADAGHDGHGQVLPHQQEVHTGRRRHEAGRLDELEPQGEYASGPRGSLRA
jgi:acetyl-CoA synthase